MKSLKTIIAFTALFAAGTAVSVSAATILTFNDKIEGSTQVSVSGIPSDPSTTLLTTPTATASFLGEYSGTLNIYRIKGGKHNQLSNTEIQDTNLWTNSSAFDILKSTTGMSAETLKGIDQGVVAGWADGGFNLELTGLTAGKTYTVTFLLGTVLTGNPGSSSSSNLKLTTGTFVDGVSASLTGTGTSDITYGNGGLLASRGNSSTVDVYSMNVTATDEGKICFELANSGGDRDSVKSSLLLMTIPEPSMFGLLAGLGALALVAARRRRK